MQIHHSQKQQYKTFESIIKDIESRPELESCFSIFRRSDLHYVEGDYIRLNFTLHDSRGSSPERSNYDKLIALFRKNKIAVNNSEGIGTMPDSSATRFIDIGIDGTSELAWELILQVANRGNAPEKSPQQRWNERNKEAIGKSQRKYEQKKPVISFRPTPEVRAKLEKSRGAGETDTDLLNRLLSN